MGGAGGVRDDLDDPVPPDAVRIHPLGVPSIGGGFGIAGLIAVAIVMLLDGLLEPWGGGGRWSVRPSHDLVVAGGASAVLVITLWMIVRAGPGAGPGVGPEAGTSPRMVVALAAVLVLRAAAHDAAVQEDRIRARIVSGLVRVEGVVTRPWRPIRDDSFAGPQAPTGWTSEVLVRHASSEALVDRRIRVRLPVRDGRLGVGTEIEARGRWRALPAPVEPGERDARGRRRGVLPGTLHVPSAALVDVRTVPGLLEGWRARIERRWREAVRAVDERVAAGSMPGLVEAVLAGDRSRLDDRWRRRAEDAGLAPLLAISGWHLTLVGGGLLLVLGRHRPIGRALALLATSAFALMVVPTAGVRRAFAMCLASGLMRLFGRRVRSLSSLGTAVWLLVAVDPSLLGSLGFQLSVLAATAIVHAVPSARRRWFGPRDRIGSRRRSLLRDRWTLAATVSMVAWSGTAPLVAGAFGRLCWAGVPAMLVVAPVFSIVVSSSLVLVVTELIVGPDVGGSVPLVAIAGASIDLFAGLVESIAAIDPVVRCPGLPVSRTPMLVASMGMVVGLGADRLLTRSTGLALAAGMVVVSGWWPIPGHDIAPGRVRVDMIAVGDGSAMLVRGRRGAVLFDAGSAGLRDVGNRRVVPALRSLGVDRLDAVVVTHANADHYNAVEAVVRAIPTEALVVSTRFLDRVRRDPSTSAARWWRAMQGRVDQVLEASRGTRWNMGDLRLRVLHPVLGEDCRTVNDASIVTAVSHVDDEATRCRFLSCGDVQDEAAARIRVREPRLAPDVCELPHHGSWRPRVAAWFRRLDPAVVLQSTGPARWGQDRWRHVLSDSWRGVTCRDGHVAVVVDADGGIEWMDVDGRTRFRRTGGPLRAVRRDFDRRISSRPP